MLMGNGDPVMTPGKPFSSTPTNQAFFASFHNRDHEDPHILSEYVVGEGDGSHLRIIRELQHSLMLEPT